MIYILCSIICSVIILMVFRQVEQHGANTRHVIMLNYLVAAMLGAFFFPHEIGLWTAKWFWPAVLMGAIFYTVFRLIAKTTQLCGLATASVATKMSVIIPIVVGLTLLSEVATVLKIVGILMAITAVWLSTNKGPHSTNWRWPILTFFASGFIDTSLNLFQLFLLNEDDFASFVTVIFAAAFATGFVHHLTFADKRISKRSLSYGGILGIANFGSLIFLLLALHEPQWQSSVVFPINNVGVVAGSTIAAFLVFKEQMNVRKLAAVGMALLSIGVLYFS